MRHWLLLSLVLCLPASPAFAAEAADDSTDDTKMICKRSTSTGWRLQGGQICRTRAAWDRHKQRLKREYENFGSVAGRTRCDGCDK